ncbi:uncharacterized protein TNCV_1312121 [Trichonephila clavipes]|nr:uncharacterized protein TNCV_1312121 [Trichonephila clavipes]
MTNFFIPELNNHDVQELWFQQDGATCHTARATIDLLKDTFGDRLISRFGPVNRPPRYCDLTPLDYFLGDYVKSLVYADKPQTLDHLEDNIRRIIADIRPQMLEKVIENWTSRLDYIRASRSSSMPEIIFKMTTSFNIPHPEVVHLTSTVDVNSQLNEQQLLQWNANSYSSSMKRRHATPRYPIANTSSLKNVPKLSSKTGIPYCRHHSSQMKHPATTLTDKRIDSSRTESNILRKISSSIRSERSLLMKSLKKGRQPEWEIVESKTRNGTVYSKVKWNKSYGVVSKA